jgi:hypothetical protein
MMRKPVRQFARKATAFVLSCACGVNAWASKPQEPNQPMQPTSSVPQAHATTMSDLRKRPIADADKAKAQDLALISTPEDQRRGFDQTLLTYPEWFLVFSPNEYGEFLRYHSPSDFPFFGHIGQFWQGYARVTDEIKAQGLPFNGGYHLMVMVIGVSTTVEYALKSAYEQTIGRVARFTAGAVTPEEKYAAEVAQDYVRFIRVEPWYKYDFSSKLKGLWKETPAFGPDMIRKWERKFALTTEYAIKMAYAKLIGLGTASVYDPALPTTAVVLKKAPTQAVKGVEVLKELPDGRSLVNLPRYEPFMVSARALAKNGAQFEEIAGNTKGISVSVLVQGAWSMPDGVTEIFAQPILTRPGVVRHLLMVPIGQLGDELRRWESLSLEIEHVFDF